MSYCRFSSDDFLCDVYVYEDCAGGWTTHVAGRRTVYKEPIPPVVSMDDIEAWHGRYVKISEMFDSADHIDIGLPYDGETFNDPTPGECADTLEKLRECGYLVPQYAIEALREEDDENGGEP